MKRKFFIDLPYNYAEDNSLLFATTQPVKQSDGTTRISFEVEIPESVELPEIIIAKGLDVVQVGKMMVQGEKAACCRMLFAHDEKNCLEQGRELKETCEVCLKVTAQVGEA